MYLALLHASLKGHTALVTTLPACMRYVLVEGQIIVNARLPLDEQKAIIHSVAAALPEASGAT